MSEPCYSSDLIEGPCCFDIFQKEQSPRSTSYLSTFWNMTELKGWTPPCRMMMSGIRSGQCRVQEKLLCNMIGGGSVSVCGLEEGRLPAFLPRTCSIASPPTIKTRPKLQVASRKCFTW
jgi:hypothetical protein